MGRGVAARLTVPLLIVAVIATACGSSKKHDAAAGTSDTTTPTTAPAATQPAATTTTTTKPKQPALVKPAVPKSGAYFGIWRGPGPNRPTDDPTIANTQAAESPQQGVDRKFAIDHHYYPWLTPFPDDYDRWTASQGRIPMISVCSCYWDKNNTPVMWADVASGKFDLYLISIADRFKAMKVPAFFAYDGEAETNAQGYSNQPRGSTQDFVHAFRHVVDVFRARGATNVAFVWTVTGYAFQAASGSQGAETASMYPGDNYVDWLGVDPYNFGRANAWNSLAYEMGPWYQWATANHPGKPLMLAEWGSVEDQGNPNRKAQWLQDAATALQTQFSKVRAVVYFDEQKFEQGTVHDWRIDTTQQSLAAFRAIAHAPWFAVMATAHGSGG